MWCDVYRIYITKAYIYICVSKPHLFANVSQKMLKSQKITKKYIYFLKGIFSFFFFFASIANLKIVSRIFFYLIIFFIAQNLYTLKKYIHLIKKYVCFSILVSIWLRSFWGTPVFGVHLPVPCGILKAVAPKLLNGNRWTMAC